MSRASTHSVETEPWFLALEFEARSDPPHHAYGVHIYAYAVACSRDLCCRAMPVFFYVCVRPLDQVPDYRASTSGEFGDGAGAGAGAGVLKVPALCPDPFVCESDPGSCSQPMPSQSLREPCWLNGAASVCGVQRVQSSLDSPLLRKFSDVTKKSRPASLPTTKHFTMLPSSL
jgi:hypothetical protein